MARWTSPLLAALPLLLLAMPPLLGEGVSSKPSSCDQRQVRYRKPPLETIPWPGYWVPLMIILGGCCALAWCILYMTYNIGQTGEKELPLPPAPHPSQPEEPATAPDGQKSWSKALFQADADVSNVETGNSPWLQVPVTGELVGSRTQLENKPTKVGLGSSPWLESAVPSEKIGSRSQLESRSTNVGLGSTPWLGKQLPSTPERSTIQLERKPTSKRTGIFSQPLETNVTAKEGRSFTHFESQALRESSGSPTPLENHLASEKVGSMAPLESRLAEEERRDGSTTRLENKLSAQFGQGGLAGQEAPSPWPGQDGEDHGSSHLWNFMEKELERLLGALRLHRSNKPASLKEQSPDLPSEEPPAPPPSATEAPSPPPATEAPNAQAEVAPGFSGGMEIQPWMFFIIPEVPRSPSRSPARGRGGKRRCNSKRRK